MGRKRYASPYGMNDRMKQYGEKNKHENEGEAIF